MPVSIVTRAARHVLPRSWFADLDRGRPGRIRRLLKRIGPTALSSPLRRISQTVCFVLFLYSFLYVCWPYDARPSAAANQSNGWTLTDLGDDGSLSWQHESVPDWILDADTQVHLVENAEGSSYIGAMKIRSSGPSEMVVTPIDPLTDDQIDRLLTSAGPWSILDRAPQDWPSHYADNLASKEWIPADLFLTIDPLVSLSTAIASRSWVWSLLCAGVILLICVFIPRGFCGYLCPLGSLIDLFDWSVTRRMQRFRLADDGWWVHTKYYILLGTLICAACGVLVSGYVSAIPVLTRGMLFVVEPFQTGVTRGWHQVPAVHAGHWLSIALFACVLCLGFLRDRFWCKYVCPSGAVFSLGNLFRATERKVESSCIHCNKCVEICPFDAIKPDFTTRTTDCTFCQTCGGACPVHAIKFVPRGDVYELKVKNDPPTHETAIGRRGFLTLAAGTAAATVGGAGLVTATGAAGANLDAPNAFRPIRPPGSVPEQEFLQMCIRCGECFKACPNHVLQAEGFQQGLEGLWAPMVNADWAGCESSCNACGQVCPTGAIRALPLEEKKVARMGLAILNEKTCLPIAGKEACQLCVDECAAAGYNAIEFTQMHTETDEQGQPIEGTGFLAPMMIDDKCVGCGLCQTRCYNINVRERDVLSESAIIVQAGFGREDRMISGSYIELRQQEAANQAKDEQEVATPFFVPDQTVAPNDGFETAPEPAAGDDDPFGLGP
tara:strand:- start:424233 stop:426398 length:2166 start_codon:yes stop_codon:yes gene_type:complete